MEFLDVGTNRVVEIFDLRLGNKVVSPFASSSTLLLEKVLCWPTASTLLLEQVPCCSSSPNVVDERQVGEAIL